ncbi:hypothetical protein EVG20_g4120 [Dentipellis fragilis]|uniref:Uncharacterized protein n=1 Tax=Dentipellis fragilis TaxID=205917 RepID=A0A4Y9YYY0_9AGAM|nr:hypothetical protein EVG20_g4120 [Dentipellis fragilis]
MSPEDSRRSGSSSVWGFHMVQDDVMSPIKASLHSALACEPLASWLAWTKAWPLRSSYVSASPNANANADRCSKLAVFERFGTGCLLDGCMSVLLKGLPGIVLCTYPVTPSFAPTLVSCICSLPSNAPTHSRRSPLMR